MNETEHALLVEIIPKMEGWLTPERAIEMFDHVIATKPKVVVELGVFGGRSLVAQAMGLRTIGCGRAYGLDSWRLSDCLEQENAANKEWWSKIDLHDIHRGAMEHIWRLGLEGRAVVIRTASQHCWELFPQIDLLNIDGNHSEVASCRDVELFVPKVVGGGYIWFDDTNWPSTEKARVEMDKVCDVVFKGHGDEYRLYRKR